MRFSFAIVLLFVAFVLQISGVLAAPPTAAEQGPSAGVQPASGTPKYSPEDYDEVHAQFAEAAENMRVLAEKSRTKSIRPEDTEAFIRCMYTSKEVLYSVYITYPSLFERLCSSGQDFD